MSPAAAVGAEMVLVVGGDGTLLRAAELARPAGVPLLGVNLGHVGFLAEAEPEDLSATVTSLAARQYSVEERMTVEVTVRCNGDQLAATWASTRRQSRRPPGRRARPRRRGRWQATVALWLRRRCVRDADRLDGLRVLGGRPGGLAGGRGAANGANLGARTVRRADGRVAEISTRRGGHRHGGRPFEMAGAVLWCDGRRMVELPPGSRVVVRRGTQAVRLARLSAVTGAEARIGAPFTDRLVAKFGLPVNGWRGNGTHVR